MKSLILGVGILSLSVLIVKCSAKSDCPEVECSHPCPHGYEVEPKTGCPTCECRQPHRSRRQLKVRQQDSCTCTCGTPGNEQVIKLPWPLPSPFPNGDRDELDILRPQPLPIPFPDDTRPLPIPFPTPDGGRPVPIPFPFPDGLRPVPLPQPIPDGIRPVPIPFPIPDGLKPIPLPVPNPNGDRDEPDITRPIPIPLPLPFPDDGSDQPLLVPIPRPGGSSLIPIPGGIKVIGIPGVVVNGQIPSLDVIYRLIPALRPENLPNGVRIEVVPGGFQIVGIPGLPGDGGSRDISTILRLFPSLAPTLGIQITIVPNQGGISKIPIKIVFGPGGIQISGVPGIGDGGKIPQLSDILKVLPGLRPESLPPGVKINLIPGGFTLSGIPGLPTDGSQPNIPNILKLIPGLQPVFTPSQPSFPDILKPIDISNLPNLPNLLLPGIKIEGRPGGFQVIGIPGIGDGGKIPQVTDIFQLLPGLRPGNLPTGTNVNVVPGGFTITGLPGYPVDGRAPDFSKIFNLIPGLRPLLKLPIPDIPTDNLKPIDISNLVPNLPNLILPGVKIEGRPGGIKIIGIPGIGDGGKVPQLSDILNRLPGLRPENLPKGVNIQLIPGGFQLSGVTGFPTDGRLPDLGRLLQLIPGLFSIFKIPNLPTDPTNLIPGFNLRIPDSVKIEGKPGGFQIVGIPGIGDNGQVPLLSDLLTRFPGLRPDALPSGSKLNVVPGGFKITGIPGLSVTGGAPNIIQLVQLIPGLQQIFGTHTPSPHPDTGRPIDPFNLPPGMKLRLPAGVKIQGRPGALYITGVEGLGVGGKIPKLDDIFDRLPELERLPSGLRIEGIAGGFRIVGVSGFPTDGSTPDFLQIVQRIPGLLPIFGFTMSHVPEPVPVPIGPGVPIALPPGVKIVGTPGGFQITGIPGLGVGGSAPQLSQIVQRIPGLNVLPPGAKIEGIAGGFRISGIAGFPLDGRVDILTILKQFPGIAAALGIQIFNVPDPRPNINTGVQSPFNLNLPASARINTGAAGLEITGIPGLGDGGTIPQLSAIVQRFPSLKAENLPTGSKVIGIPGGFRVSGFVGFTSETIPGSVHVVNQSVRSVAYD